MYKLTKEFAEQWPKRNAVVKFNKYALEELAELSKRLCGVHHASKSETKKKQNATSIKQVMENSKKFPLKFACDTCRITSQPKSRHPMIQKQIDSAYPVIHERVLALYLAFLEHKKRYGNSIELKVYADMTIDAFIDRLLLKRCASFFGENDSYLLVSGETGIGGFDVVGTPRERRPIVLENVLSCDENKLSALLSVSSHSEFLNKGDRHNCGYIEPDKTQIVPEGIIIGVIGPFMKRPGLMDYQDVIIKPDQNTLENGYGGMASGSQMNRQTDYRRLWNELYEEPDHLDEQIRGTDNERFLANAHVPNIIDTVVLKKRYTISFDTLLWESEARAAAAGKQAYIHIVGIGLGVWRVTSEQTDIFLETFGQRLYALVDQLPHVAVVNFSWFHIKEKGMLHDGGVVEGSSHPSGGISTYFSERNPADKLPSEHKDMLVVVSYAWDGNALPGNEFWMGSLSGSGDPAAACSTLIAELHNPHINGAKVSGENLHIASAKYGTVMHVGEYAERILTESNEGPK